MPTLGGGGAERVCVSLCHYFVAQGFRVRLLLTKGGNTAYEIPSGTKVVAIDGSKGTGPVKQLLFLRRQIRAARSAVFLSMLADQNLLLLVASVGLPNRAYVSVRNVPSEDFRGNRVLQRLRDVLYSIRSSGVICQSEWQGRQLALVPSARMAVIGNPLPLLLPGKFLGRRRRVVAASGRLTTQKNYPMLLRAFSRVHCEIPDLRLEIYGDGDLEMSLKDYARELGVSGSVDFLGFRSDSNSLIRSATAFAMTSDFEGQPNALLEAMSMGVPVVSTRCDGEGAETLIDDGINGFLVDKDDDEAMARRLMEIARSQDLSEALSNGALTLRHSHDLMEIGRKWERFLFSTDGGADGTRSR